MQNLRHERVRELLKREVGEVIRRELPLEQAGMITVNEVGVSNDLKSATIYVGVIGSPEQRQNASSLLNKESKRLQGLIGRSIILKYTPHLKFVVDRSVERGNRVLEILDQIEKSSSPNERSSQDS
jgi:ribosome-binding factor A